MVEKQWVTAVVIAEDGVRILDALSDVDASALRGCVADDPGCWSDVALLWPRYVFHPENAEFVEGLPLRFAELDAAVDVLNSSRVWFAIDLVGRRLLTSDDHVHVRLLREPLAEGVSDFETLVLPPWWQLCQRVRAELLAEKRQPPAMPHPRRDVLWGPPLFRYFAHRMIAAVRSGQPWVEKDWEGNPCGNREWTKVIHRDWLMTPHPLLGGGIPRDALHAGMNWIADLANGQQFHLVENDLPVPVSPHLSTYEDAPPGRHEVILYFDACRETLDAGWRWLIENPACLEDSDAEDRLADVMDGFLTEWMWQPFEGGWSVAEIIRCERLRIPLIEKEGHILDCDCPLCQMLADGMFGPGFICFDGHQLELDDEFAFSLCSTRDKWEEQQREWADMRASVEADLDQRAEMQSDSEREDGFPKQPDKQWLIGDGIANILGGHWQLAFSVAGIVGALKSNQASQADVDALNAAFRAYRESGRCGTIASSLALKETLQRLSEKHEFLASRCDDLQSQLDRHEQGALLDDPNSPF